MRLVKQIMRVAARGQRTVATQKTRLVPYSPMKSSWIEERLPSPATNCQKSSNMRPMEPNRIPNARGSLRPPSVRVFLKNALGEKATCLAVCKTPSLRPISVRLSHGGGTRVKSKRSLHRGHVAHRTPGGILSSSSCFEYRQLGQVISTVIIQPFPVAYTLSGCLDKAQIWIGSAGCRVLVASWFFMPTGNQRQAIGIPKCLLR